MNYPTRASLKFITLVFLIFFNLSCAEIQNLVTTKEALYYPSIEQKNRIKFLTTINSKLSLHKPYGIAYYKSRIFLVDSRKPGYFIMDTNGKVLKTVVGSKNIKLLKPINISIDRQGNRYVTDAVHKLVLKFDRKDNYKGAIGLKRKFKPVDAQIRGIELYVSDIKAHKIHIFNKNNGRLIRSFSRPGSKDGELFFPTNISLSKSGQILVSDTGNNRIQLYNNEGYLIKKYGDAGNGLGQFSRPKGVALDRRGRVYAIDSAFENIQLFNRNGELLLVFGKSGNTRGDINLPADISISYDGIDAFTRFTNSEFKIHYLIFVTSQYGPNKINVYGFGHYRRG